MVSITKTEALYLAKQGARYKDILHRTTGVAKKYYMTEDRFWMKRLEQYRDKRVVK